MSRLAQAIQAASHDALVTVSLESLATEMATNEVSMEQHVEDLNALTTMATGLDKIVVSFESLENPTSAQRNDAREQALSILQMSGLSASDAIDIFPSMESEGTSAWEKFKAFLKRVWDFIVEAAKRIFEFVNKVLAQSTMAEKAVMSKLRQLRKKLKEEPNGGHGTSIRNGVTINASIPLRPAHRYILDSNNQAANFAAVKQNVETFIKGRDAVQVKLPVVIREVCEKLRKAVDQLAILGNDQQVSESIIKNSEALRAAAAPMFPDALTRALGFSQPDVPLIYDRVIRIAHPVTVADNLITDEQVAAHIGQFGLDVTQIETPALAEDMGNFPAMRISEIEELFKLVERLVDTGHSADQRRQWFALKGAVKQLNATVNGVIIAVLKKPDLSYEARVQMKMVLNASRAANKWVAAPFMQLNTINVRVADSLLNLAHDQMKNYELEDGLQDRLDKAAEEQRKKDKKKKDE